MFVLLAAEINVIFSFQLLYSETGGFLSPYTFVPSLRRVFCVLNHKYIVYFYLLSLISNYFCVFTAFAAIYIFQQFIKSQRGFSNAGAGAGYTFYTLVRGRYSLKYCRYSFYSFTQMKKGKQERARCNK